MPLRKSAVHRVGRLLAHGGADCFLIREVVMGGTWSDADQGGDAARAKMVKPVIAHFGDSVDSHRHAHITMEPRSTALMNTYTECHIWNTSAYWSTSQRTVPRSRISSAHAKNATDASARNGWTGANHLIAPEVPSASKMSLLHTGQPTAKKDTNPPTVPSFSAVSACSLLLVRT